MGTDNLFHKRKSDSYKRKSKNKKPHQRILIVCEGEKTEPNYFMSFDVNKQLVDIKIIGEGRNTTSLVKQANEIFKTAKKDGEPFEQVWCVFDKDFFSDESFNNAINQCESKNGFNAAYSNEAFEIWYLLHFNYHDTAYSRSRYAEMLSERLNIRYEKNLKNIYGLLENRQETAIKNAKKLIENYNPHNPARDNPCTTVYKLVEELNKYLRK